MIFIFFFLELLLLFLLSRSLTKSLSKLFIILSKSQRIAVQLLAILFLPGVIIHEISHLIMAGILFVPTGEIEFMPQIKEEGSVKLGSVAIAKTDPLRRALIGFAPFLVGVFILISVLFYFNTLDLPISPLVKKLIELFIVFQISNTMFSSRKDVEGVLELLVVLVIFGGVLFFIGFGIPQFVLDYLLSERVVESLYKINTMLLVPLGIDVAIIGITRLLLKR